MNYLLDFGFSFLNEIFFLLNYLGFLYLKRGFFLDIGKELDLKYKN